jgi:hypothetical protein
MALPAFPSTGSIPPPYFYNMQGLPLWLNQNPTFKHYFIHQAELFPMLLPANSTLSTIGYSVENVPLPPFVTNLSISQAQTYQQQMNLFRKVYAYNSNAYLTSITTQKQQPYYYFQSYKEYHEYKSSVALANKLYRFDIIKNTQNEAGSTLGWMIPFPL